MSHDKASEERIMKENRQSLNMNDVLSVNDALNKNDDGGNEIWLRDIRDYHRQHKGRPILVCIETETYILHCVSKYA